MPPTKRLRSHRNNLDRNTGNSGVDNVTMGQNQSNNANAAMASWHVAENLVETLEDEEAKEYAAGELDDEADETDGGEDDTAMYADYANANDQDEPDSEENRNEHDEDGNSNGARGDSGSDSGDEYGPQKFKCPFRGCDRVFRSKGAMYSHRQTHKPGKFYECPERDTRGLPCLKAYKRANGLAVHMKTKHGKNVKPKDVSCFNRKNKRSVSVEDDQDGSESTGRGPDYMIEVDVAGFGKDDIGVHIDPATRELVIQATSQDDRSLCIIKKVPMDVDVTSQDYKCILDQPEHTLRIVLPKLTGKRRLLVSIYNE